MKNKNNRITKIEYLKYLYEIHGYDISSDVLDDVRKYGLDVGTRFNMYGNTVYDWVSMLPKLESDGIDAWVNVVRHNNYDDYELMKDNWSMVNLHRLIIIVYGLCLGGTVKTSYPMIDVINMSTAGLVEYELAYQKKWGGDWHALHKSDINSEYIYISSVVYNTTIMSGLFKLIHHRRAEIGSAIRKQSISIIELIHGRSRHINVSIQDFIGQSQYADLRCGWNLITSTPLPITAGYVLRMPMLSPMYVTPTTDMYTTLKSNNVWIPGYDYCDPSTNTSNIENVVHGTQFLDALNKINSHALHISHDAVKHLNHIIEYGVDNEFTRYIIGTDAFKTLCHKTIIWLCGLINHSDVFLRYTFDRRGRLHCWSYPWNPQHFKIARFILENVRTLVLLKNCVAHAHNRGIWASLMDKKDMPNKLMSVFSKIKWCTMLTSDELLYVQVCFRHILQKIVFRIEKPTVCNTNLGLLEKHEDCLLNMIDSSINESALSVIYKYNLQVKADEYMEWWSQWESLLTILSGGLPGKFLYSDASSNVFQLHVLFNASLNPHHLHITGIVPDKNNTSSGIYVLILERLIGASPTIYHKLLTRELVKVISMPRIYGLTFIGMLDQIRNVYSNAYLLEVLGDIGEMRKFHQFLWFEVSSILDELGLNPKNVMCVVRKLYKLKNTFIWNGVTDVPMYLDKQVRNKNIRIRKTKSVLYTTEDGVRIKFDIKRDVHSFAYKKDIHKSISGLYVGMIHGGDASIQHILILNISGLCELISIHDSNGCPAIASPIIVEEYLRAMSEWVRMTHKNHPILKYIDNNNNSLLDPDIKGYYQSVKDNIKQYESICIQIESSERAYF